MSLEGGPKNIETEHMQAEKIVTSLLRKGYKFVYINKQTGMYGGERSLVDFPMGLRPDCYIIDEAMYADYSDYSLATKDRLVQDLVTCLSLGKSLKDVSKN